MAKEEQDTLEISAFLITGAYVLLFIGAVALYLFVHMFWGEYQLLNFSDISSQGLSVEGLSNVWFIFLWGAFATMVIYAIKGRPEVDAPKPLQFVRGLWLSLNAGFFEELIYRWLVFFTAMITLPFFNFITFGLVKWWYTAIAVPVANWSTFHALEPWLLHQENWAFGAAIVSASVSFRDGHKHLGVFGWVNSWFGGMVMFYLVLNYGLVTAIVAHAVYDAIIFTIKASASTQTRYWFPIGRSSWI
jgi:hypothetical protein